MEDYIEMCILKRELETTKNKSMREASRNRRKAPLSAVFQDPITLIFFWITSSYASTAQGFSLSQLVCGLFRFAIGELASGQ